MTTIPLTMPETLAAIAATPTEPDILKRACVQFLYSLEECPDCVVVDVLDRYSHSERLDILVNCLSAIAALTVKEGHEKSLARGLCVEFINRFREVILKLETQRNGGDEEAARLTIKRRGI